jgi:DNA-binding protein Fis
MKLFRKNPKKVEKQARRNRALGLITPYLLESHDEFNELSRKERKIYEQEMKKIGEHVRSSLPRYFEQLDRIDVGKIDRSRIEQIERPRRKMIKKYLAEHQDIPENIRITLLKTNNISRELIDKLIKG